MFLHQQKLQYNATPEAPDAVYARKLQEVIGGQYGEITVPMPPPSHPDARFYGTAEVPNVVEKTAGAVQDKPKKE